MATVGVKGLKINGTNNIDSGVQETCISIVRWKVLNGL